MLFYALFSQLRDSFFSLLIIKLGALSYSFFLMHNFFVQWLNGYFGNSLMSFWKTLIVSTICSLLSALLIEKLIPIVSKVFSTIWMAIDKKLGVVT
jgi:peptidoglycan/LPS O-acetylase OafA/YrhL